jgi:tryptophanyl-tRNA synthetase
MRILSGIQPSGTIHVGNYFGMIKPLLDFQDKGEVFGFLADYHSMTSLFDAKERLNSSLESATTLLACGLDPKKITFFKQSDVPEVTELAWILSTVTPMGLLERCHSYKDKKAKGISASHGLFAYPVLMAADILIYHSKVVPVGKDQIQHVEVACDIAASFNNKYGRVFTLPESYVQEQTAIVPGLDGQKMSYGNTIEVFGEEKPLRKKIMSIVMDSRGPTEPKPDADKNIAINLYKLFVSSDAAQEVETKLREGKLGYGDLKLLLFEAYHSYFEKPRQLYNELSANPDYVKSVLQDGANKARTIAQQTMKEVRQAVGL